MRGAVCYDSRHQTLVSPSPLGSPSLNRATSDPSPVDLVSGNLLPGEAVSESREPDTRRPENSPYPITSDGKKESMSDGDSPDSILDDRAVQVTGLLASWRQGDAQALEQLTPVVYSELRRLARGFMRGERAGHVLQTTALVHEAYIKLIDLELEWQDRIHFFSVAARLMRRVLVDFARERKAEKRGGGAEHVALDEALVGEARDIDLLALDQALGKLAEIDPRKVQVVEMRCFAGMTIRDVSEVLGVAHATVERDLAFARAWLARRLAGDGTST